MDGLLDYRGEVKRGREVAFKRNNESSTVIYTPDALQKYGFDQGQLYITKQVPGSESVAKFFFLEALALGKANLYFLRETDVTERFFIETVEGKLVELKEETRQLKDSNGKTYNSVLKPYISVLTVALIGCDGMQSQIERTELKQSSLKKLVNNYNACVAPKEEGFAKEGDHKFKVSAGVLVGGSVQQLTISGEEEAIKYYGEFDPYTSITGGIAVDLNLREVNEKLSVYTGAFYSRLKTQAFNKAKTLNGSEGEFDVSFDAQFLSFPLMLRYTYPKGKLRPFVNLGASYTLLLSMDGVRHSVYNKDTSYERQYTGDAMEKYKKANFGLIGGAGILAPISKKMDFVTELRLSRRGGFSSALAVDTKIQEISLAVGIMFK
ncbi:hypothetical protein GCM10027293_01860 [Pontibacter aydingkolensis]